MKQQDSMTGIQFHDIQKYDQGKLSTFSDALAIETPLLIKLKTPDGDVEDLVITMQTPIHQKELVTGFLYTDGIINQAEDIVDISLNEDEATVTLSSRPAKLQARNTVSTAACGMCGKTSLEAIKLVREFQMLDRKQAINKHSLLGLDAQLREKQALFAATGGIHAAALFDLEGCVLASHEDIGRHNAVDKAIGSMLINGLPKENLGLFVSGRAGFELVQKCLVSGISLMVAVGAPSSLAVDYAQKYGLTLIGFMQKDRFNVYTHPQRVALNGIS